MTIAQLREFQDCKVILRLGDGEVLTASVVYVDLEHQGIVVDVLSTNRLLRYQRPPESAYAIKGRWTSWELKNSLGDRNNRGRAAL